jgi:hypothetical protein
MFPIVDVKIKEFCKDVLDVEYIVYTIDWDFSKHSMTSEQEYIDLKLLYCFNEVAKSKGQEPYVQLLEDASGSKYAHLSEEGAKYAFNNDLSFIPEYKKRDARNVPLRKAAPKLVDNNLEDRICEKCGNVLGLDCTHAEFQVRIDSIIYGNKKNSATNKRKANPWDNVFLSFKDIPGSYMS